MSFEGESAKKMQVRFYGILSPKRHRLASDDLHDFRGKSLLILPSDSPARRRMHKIGKRLLRRSDLRRRPKRKPSDLRTKVKLTADVAVFLDCQGEACSNEAIHQNRRGTFRISRDD